MLSSSLWRVSSRNTTSSLWRMRRRTFGTENFFAKGPLHISPPPRVFSSHSVLVSLSLTLSVSLSLSVCVCVHTVYGGVYVRR